MANDHFVRFENVDKSYDGKQLVVKGLNLDIAEGEFVTMLGPSGSGKTTCLMMLAGFETATNGQIFLDNKINKVSKNLKYTMKSDLKIIKKNWPKRLPSGVIHCDLFVDNIFFYKRKFYGFIDFYFASNDFLTYELATSVNALCFDKKNNKFLLNKDKSSKLIKGYEIVRKLTIEEKQNFNTICRGSALRYLLTRSYDYLNTPKSAVIKIKDPKEYVQKLNFHRSIKSFKEYLN